MSWGISHRHGPDPELLWLQCRPATIVAIRPLAWELAYAVGAALKKEKKIKRKKNKRLNPPQEQVPAANSGA